ncbi:MAG: hypothetical protein ACUVX1_13405, partial [Chloroflexota bacterium]
YRTFLMSFHVDIIIELRHYFTITLDEMSCVEIICLLGDRLATCRLAGLEAAISARRLAPVSS